MSEDVARSYSAIQNSKIYKEVNVPLSLSNTVKSFQAVNQAVRLVTLLKKDPLTGFSELAVCRSSRK